jgi:class 3 adenylate cyclase
VNNADRAGLMAGHLLVRDGDCFGPIVNLAARAARAAAPGSVLATSGALHQMA